MPAGDESLKTRFGRFIIAALDSNSLRGQGAAGNRNRFLGSLSPSEAVQGRCDRSKSEE